MYTKKVEVIDWELVPIGAIFTATIVKTKCTGRIYKDKQNNVFLCQDTKNGTTIPNKLGFKYAWRLEREVKNLKLTAPAKDYKIPEIFDEDVAGYRPIFEKGYIKIGCKTIKNSTIKKLIKFLK